MAVKALINTNLINGWIASGFWTQRCIARAPSGRLWIAYFDSTWPLNNLFAAYSDNNGISWTEELVVNSADISSYTQCLVVDNLGVLHIFYATRLGGVGNDRLLMHTYRTGGVWILEGAIYDAGAGVSVVAIASCVDLTNTIHIAFRNHVTGAHYMSGITGAWSANELINTVPFNFMPQGLDINSASVPHVVGEEGTGQIIMAIRLAGVWQVPELLTAGGWGPSISFDDADQLHACWIEVVGVDMVRYRKRSVAGVWGAVIDVIDDWIALLIPALAPSMTVDTDGNAYVIVQKDDVGGDEAVYYKRVNADETLGVLTLLDGAIVRPNNFPSVYTSPFHGGSTTSLVAPAYHPIAVLLSEQNDPFGFPEANGYFESPGVPPTVQTDPATMVTQLATKLNGTLIADGGEVCACGFEWGRTIAYGNTTQTQNRVAGQTFSQDILALLSGTTYHFRAFATNSVGIVYGADRTFITAPAGSFVCPYDGAVFTSWGALYIYLLTVYGVYICTHCGALFSTWGALYSHLGTHGIFSAQVMTLAATYVTENAARLNGMVIEDLGVVSETRFQYGLTTDYGNNTPWQHGFAKGDTFFVNLTGLGEGTAFHFRAQMRNQGGVVSGNDMAFNTLSPLGPVTLIDDELIYLLEAV